MTEEQLQELAENAAQHVNNIEFMGEGVPVYSFEQLEEMFIAGYKAKEEDAWISVEKELPKIPKPYYDEESECNVTPCSINVLVYDDESVFTESYGIFPFDKGITHWMYFPQPPTQKQLQK